MKKIYIVVDFDGTIVEHRFPEISPPVPGALEALKRFQDKGYLIILNTMRGTKQDIKDLIKSGYDMQPVNITDCLTPAVDFIKSQGINLYGINHNPDQKTWTDSPKVYGHFYIDDAAAGCPLIYPEKGRPYVNWPEIEKDIEMKINKGWVKSH